MNLAAIPALASDDLFHVVVEAPRGSALKLKYEPQWDVMSISRPLPLGLTFPFDWGFVVVRCRAIGVLQVEQNRINFDSSERIRNDRVLAIPVEARRERAVTEFREFPDRVREELEQFTRAATALEGKDARIVGWGSAAEALELVKTSARLPGVAT
jgi:inorganic pyrophosphatase